jgi:hypothetical protein
MRATDTFRHTTSRIPWLLLLGTAWALSGPAFGAAASKFDPSARVKDFLGDPNVVTAALVTKEASQLVLPGGRRSPVLARLQQERTGTVKEGELTLARRPFRVFLGPQLEREFCLYDVQKGYAPYWWGSWSLHSYHKIDDQFYEFVLLEDGARIAARPYRGPLGTIKVGKGNRTLDKVEFNGSVFQKGHVAAPIGTVKDYWTGPVTECRVPVGDYTPYLMTVTYDNLVIEISNNYYAGAQGQPQGREPVYGMSVRADRPYVLDFSNAPVIIFDELNKEGTFFRRGAEVKFAAVLVDPKLDIMIRGLDDTAVQVEEKQPDGSTFKRPKSLAPKIVIARANGEVVAQDIMPFG